MRVHRTFLQRVQYSHVYRCAQCSAEMGVPLPYQHHFGAHCLCPRCGTSQVHRLTVRDPLDPMQKGLVNLWKRVAGGKLIYCRFCRLQFYDRRPLARDVPARAASGAGSGSGSAIRS